MLDQDDGAIVHIFPTTSSSDATTSMVATGFVKTSDDAADLGDALGVDGATLEKTVETWNEDIADGKDDQFGRDDEGVVALVDELYGYEFHLACHYFMGGVLINTTAQVVDEDDAPIPGLYAAGEVTGGMQGTTRVDGSGLGDSFVFGRIAGKNAAAAALA